MAKGNGTDFSEISRGAQLAHRIREAAKDEAEESGRADTLRRIRMRPVGRGVADAIRTNVDDTLSDLYDPDSITRSFYKPAEEIYRMYQVPVRNTATGEWCDPVTPHRLQLVEVDRRRKGQFRTRQIFVRSAKDLKQLSETQEYRRSKWYESTGDFPMRVSTGDWTRLRESLGDPFAFGLDPGDSGNAGNASVTRDMDQEFIPLIGGPYYRQTYLYAHWEQVAKAFYEKNHNDLAKAAINITTDFTIGQGVASKIKNPKVRAIWSEFWVRNGMEWRLRVLCDDLTWSGELLIKKYEVVKGFLSIRSIDPSAILEVVTIPQDIEAVILYHEQAPCIHGDTRIALLDGTNPTVRELAQRNEPYWVYSYDESTQRICPGLATKTWNAGVKRCVKITLDNDESVICSFDHPFLLRDGTYVHAEHLKHGDSLMPLYRRTGYEDVAKASSKNNHKVVSVTSAGEYEVFDIQVDKFHNFALTAGVFTHNTPYQLPYTQFKGQNLNIPLQKYVINQYAASEIFHIKSNVCSNEKRGRSDFYTSFGTLKRHRDWVNATTLKGLLQANLVWKIKLHGDDADVTAFVNDPSNAQLPAFGGTWIENDALTLGVLHQDVDQSGGRMGVGSTGAFLTALFATAQCMPVSYFNQTSAGMARANAMVQSEPFSRKISTRQQVMQRLLDHLYYEVMDRAVRAGRIDPALLRGEDADPEWMFPEIYEVDRGAKFRDLTTAKGMAAISHRTMSVQMGKELNLDKYDYEAEQKEILAEADSPLLKLWPPHPAGTQSAIAPSFPGTPVPPFASPNKPPDASSRAVGTPREIAGADESNKLKTLDHPSVGVRQPSAKK